jgi:hypothetical protein
LDNCRDLLAAERETSTRLRERLRASHRVRWLQTLCIAVGGVVAGVAGPHLGDPHPGWAIGGTVLGLVLISGGASVFGPGADEP